MKQQINNNSNKLKSCQFVPFVFSYLKGVACELNQLENISHIMLGVSFIRVKSMGDCCCKHCLKPSDNELVIKMKKFDFFFQFDFDFFLI